MIKTGVPADSWRRDPRVGWIVLALGALGVFILIALFATAWPAFSLLDGRVSSAVRSVRSPALSVAASWLTELASQKVVLPVTFLIAVWMAFKRNWAAVIYAVMTVPVGWFLGNDVIKNIIRRSRPEDVNIAPISGDFSMPSGHALGAFLLFATLCVIVMLNVPVGRHMKRWIAVASAVAIIVMGLARVYLGVHWFGDVLAAWLFGGAWWLFTTATYFGSVTETRKALRSGIQSPTSASEMGPRA